MLSVAEFLEGECFVAGDFNVETIDYDRAKECAFIVTPFGKITDVLLQVLITLRGERFTHVFLYLDDFLLTRNVDFLLLSEALKYVKDTNALYLSLSAKPRDDSLVGRFFKNEKLIRSVGYDEPYPTSLRPSVWDLNFFIGTVEVSKDLWEVERNPLNQNISRLFCCTESVVPVWHLVEKGRPNPLNIFYKRAREMYDTPMLEIFSMSGIMQFFRWLKVRVLGN